MSQLVLRRRGAELIRRARGWLLVYGRRKVGKTSLLRREIAWDL
jgi:AAA+ ATPase superfamily predicted ATPase